MESIIETFHIDIRLLLAQAVNFAIVFAVLYFFALKPLAKIMSERTKKIEKSLEDAKNIEDKLRETKMEYDGIIAQAKKDANEILEKANAVAEVQKKETIAKVKEEIGQVINKEKAQMQIEKSNTLKEIKKEVADLVTLSLEKILGEKVDVKKDKEVIKKIIQ